MKKQSSFQQTNPFDMRPASMEEAGLFYSELNGAKDKALGTVGHVRLDFGSSGHGFYHTWWPHNDDQFNTPEFKEALQGFVDALRKDGPLKDLPAMSAYCRQYGGAITEDGRSCGYIAEMGSYRFCLRCTPSPGDYQGYLYCYDLHQQNMGQQNHPVGRVTYGTHVLEAVRCLPLFPDDTEGENVLASDYRKFLLWAQQPEAKAAEKRCITELGLRYALYGKMIAPIPPSEELSDDFMDKYLWLNVGGELQSAIRQIYVAGMGWVSPAALNRLSSPPLVLKYRVDGVTEQGAYLSLEIEPWEYEPLVRQTENHFDLERKGEQ